MDIRKFVQTQEAALKRYRRTYKLLDFLTILILIYTLLILLSVDQALPLIRSLEVRLETTYNVAGLSITFTTIVLLIVSALVSLILTLILHRKDARTSAIQLIEEKYPSLRERLRTAYDNREVDNIVVNDLDQKIFLSIAQLGAIILLSKKILTLALMGVVVSSTIVTVVTVYDIRIVDITTEDWKELIDNLPFVPGNSNGDDLFEIDENGQESTGTENITGETAVIVVEGTEVDLSLPPGSGVGFNEGNDSEQDTDFVSSPSYEIDAMSSPTYYESFPEGYESVIKSYFEQMAQK